MGHVSKISVNSRFESRRGDARADASPSSKYKYTRIYIARPCHYRLLPALHPASTCDSTLTTSKIISVHLPAAWLLRRLASTATNAPYPRSPSSEELHVDPYQSHS